MLLTLSDEPIVLLPLEDKKLVGNLQACADQAAEADA